ncbi:trehalose-6-phosphate synthase [Sandaracinobacter sp. RS1-74]|uniref:alpha,alpha-trehalose-phosphate synthase (UDP-forming) n=1 Tax=Sandaracinobacteroides sayramensis TaxID=2913411 RepID=UPI001EDBD01F|nr:trehalose-6-phosphate synthase [Sandaracinobacteroides sayramensis]MCG2842612.1 trehalose-6-phosphate synthase [Sandaracinobacteroides sayramensis]
MTGRRRLVVVSNRVAAPRAGSPGNQGGLAVALESALKQTRGIWFGWSGETVDEFNGHIRLERNQGITTATIDLTPEDVASYYEGYSNRTLWPLFHYRIDLAEYDRQFEAGYASVNRRFAETLAQLLDPDDIVWVHDYHLIPLARELRALGVCNRIGFFLHTPWPPVRLLTTLPDHRQLVEALFSYDLLGFQASEWLDSFTDYVTREADGRLGPDGEVAGFGLKTEAALFPIGIDAAAFRRAAQSPEARAMAKRMRTSIAGRHMLVGVDRLDYSKGLEERFLGYERFLSEDPESLNRVFLLQIAPPSREGIGSYQEIRDKLDQLSGRINGAHAEVDWVPLRYVNRGYSRRELAGIFRTARVGLVTPLRDGMNLVAKEYVAAQDAADPGVLVLSRFAGAAEDLAEALLVNPFSQEDIADSIRQALAMERPERIRRWEALMARVETNDVAHWQKAFLSRLAG